MPTGTAVARNQQNGAWSDDEVDAVMDAAQVLVGVIADSNLGVEKIISAAQRRVLVLAAAQGPLSLATVAAALGVHASNATRAVDRLVALGLLVREDAMHDRRTVVLTLTPRGKDLVDSVMAHRRQALGGVLGRMSADQRRVLVHALQMFATAAGEQLDPRLWPRLLPQ